jgi:PAS domain S-box-containing protein
MNDPAAMPASALFAASPTEILLAVGLAKMGIWRRDVGADQIHCNDQAMAIIGLPAQAGSLPIATMRERIHPEDLPRVRASIQAAQQSHQPTDVQARYRHQDGSWRWVLTRRALQRGPDGQAQSYVGVVLDVTEQVEQAQRADDSLRRFELVTRTAGLGYWTRRADEPEAVWSLALRELYGLAPDQPSPGAEEWLSHFVHPDDRAEMRRRLSALLSAKEGSQTMRHRIVRPDGSLRHILSHARHDSSAGQRLTYGVVIDLTEQRVAELALQNAATRAALAAHAIGMGAWEVDIETGRATWDEQMWALRKLPPRAQALEPAERLALVHPDDRERVSQVNARSLDSGLPVEMEFRVVWPDGTVRWLASRSLVLSADADGKRRRIGVNWDITDMRAAQTALQEREVALRESQAKSQFLSRMSHELRTPLNAVLGFTQLLLADERGPDAAQQLQQRLTHIRAAGQHLLSLINDVLDLSSLQSGELSVNLQALPLAPLVSQTVPMLAPLLAGRRVHVQCGLLEGTVLADPTRLRQVLIKLLSNAIKYNREGGRVHVEALALGDEVALRVTDTGPGLSAEEQRQLFEPFSRSTRRAQAGSDGDGAGIGLALAKALTERMGGSMHVKSALGEGSVFEARFKAATVTSAAGAASPAPARAALAAAALQAVPQTAAPAVHQLLYIEDNPVNALIVKELLSRRSDLKLHLAVDGKSGVALAAQVLPDLILIDMHLPDMDGIEVLRLLRAQEATMHTRCVALSANAMPEDIQRARQAGMLDYWTKPLDFKAFLAALDKLFGAPAAA